MEVNNIEIQPCMNPQAISCAVCPFNDKFYQVRSSHVVTNSASGQPWCPANERAAKRLLDIERAKGEAA